MADLLFDRGRFGERLSTRRLGRTLVLRAEVHSTNDEAWDALAAGLPDGGVVVADTQTRGRGRAGRTWTHAPGQGLALSVALHLGCDVRQAGLIPLAAGVAIARAVAALGAAPRLKWPNDVLLEEGKLAGVLCELRRLPAGGEVVVIGIGVNVRQRREDFPSELRASATSLAIAGVEAAVEDIAAGFLNAFEPCWTELEEGDRSRVLDAWRARAAFWGEPVTVRTPAGKLTGIMQRLDDDGGLVLRLENGTETTVMAGDLEPREAPGPEPHAVTDDRSGNLGR